MVFDSTVVFESDPSILEEVSTPLWFERMAGGRIAGQTSRPAGGGWNVLSVGGAGSGVGWHAHGESWLGAVHGRKRWFVCPPGGLSAAEIGSPLLSSFGWVGRHYAAVAAGEGVPCYEAEQVAGELMYLPPGWIHATLAVGEEISIGFGGQRSYAAADGDDDRWWEPVSAAAHRGDREAATAVGQRLLSDGSKAEALVWLRRAAARQGAEGYAVKERLATLPLLEPTEVVRACSLLSALCSLLCALCSAPKPSCPVLLSSTHCPLCSLLSTQSAKGLLGPEPQTLASRRQICCKGTPPNSMFRASRAGSRRRSKRPAPWRLPSQSSPTPAVQTRQKRVGTTVCSWPRGGCGPDKLGSATGSGTAHTVRRSAHTAPGWRASRSTAGRGRRTGCWGRARTGRGSGRRPVRTSTTACGSSLRRGSACDAGLPCKLR